MAVLDPEVVLRADGGTARPARAWSSTAPGRWPPRPHRRPVRPFVRPALVNGTAGAVVVAGGRLLSVMAFTVANGRVAAIDVLFDPDRLAGLDLAVLDDPP